MIRNIKHKLRQFFGKKSINYITKRDDRYFTVFSIQNHARAYTSSHLYQLVIYLLALGFRVRDIRTAIIADRINEKIVNRKRLNP